MKLKQIKIKDIRPYFRNPRKNTETVELLEKAIEKYGFNVPLVVDSSNVIVTGHARYRALRQLGYESVPCVVRDYDAKLAAEYRIADNSIREVSQWDTEMLLLESQGLKLVSTKVVLPKETGVNFESQIKHREAMKMICPNCFAEFVWEEKVK
jgi:hypothetical protein